MTEKKKRISTFYIVYAAAVVLVIIAVQIALLIVRGYLADFESAQPQHEAARVFETYYTSDDFSALVVRSEIALTDYESTDAVTRYLKEFTSGKKITYSAITTGLDSSVRYIVKADDIKFSAFTLEESDKTTEKGFTLYEVTDFELYCVGNESVTVTAPRGYSVLLNGISLTETALTGNETRDKSCDYMPEGVEGIVLVEYKVDGLYYPPQSLKVYATDGRECDVTAESGAYRADVLYDDSLSAVHGEYVIAAAQAISAFMQNDGRFSTAAAYIDPESTLYNNIRTSETYFVISHDSYAFEDVSVSEFYQYDDDTFSCRVSFTHVLKRTWSKDYKDYIDITYFLRRVGDKFLIYDRYNH